MTPRTRKDIVNHAAMKFVETMGVDYSYEPRLCDWLKIIAVAPEVAYFFAYASDADLDLLTVEVKRIAEGMKNAERVIG